jgi:AraC-like DNA-binding protein
MNWELLRMSLFCRKESIEAKELLASQNSIKETAYQTGFSDTNYFTRVFKQLVGVTPKSYQDKIIVLE